MDNKMDNKMVNLTDREYSEFLDFIMGKTATPPDAFKSVMNNFINKLTMTLGMSVVTNISRQRELQDYINSAEKVIFSKESILQDEPEELLQKYRLAVSELGSNMEMVRKFITQNKDFCIDEDTPAQQLANKIMSLSPDKINKLLEELDRLK